MKQKYKNSERVNNSESFEYEAQLYNIIKKNAVLTKQTDKFA